MQATTDPLPVYRAVMLAVGPEELANIARPLTDDEMVWVDAFLARFGGDPFAALGAEHLPADVNAELRRVMASDGAR